MLMAGNKGKKLADLLQTVGLACDPRVEDTGVSAIVVDSREAAPGCLFVALSGTSHDGHDYIGEAISKGCIAVLAEKKPEGLYTVPVVIAPDTRQALGYMAAAFYDYPAEEAVLIGITGTNGKTTSAWLVEGVLKEAGYTPGVIGTVNIRFQGEERHSQLTTPEPLELQKTLREMVDRGVSHVVMEVSSHALQQGRVNGVHFDVALFTNLSRDHLDYHPDMGEYFQVKTKLFSHYLKTEGTAVINLEGDEQGGEDRLENSGKESPGGQWGVRLAALLQKQEGPRIVSCGLNRGDVYAEATEYSLEGISAEIVASSGRFHLQSSLVGDFNLNNLIGAAGCGFALGLSLEVIRRGLESVKNIPGRLERVPAPSADSVGRNAPQGNGSGRDRDLGGHGNTLWGFPPGSPRNRSLQPAVEAVILVDYAHTPDALEHVLATLRPLVRNRLIVVFGCGGDRDKGKRPLMGEVAGRLGDIVILTSDNPRSESPEDILGDIEEGMTALPIIRGSIEEIRERGIPDNSVCANSASVREIQPARVRENAYCVIQDRSRAIREAINISRSGDAVVICGKGHESYQIGKFGTIFFDDRLEAIKALNSLERK